MSFPEIPLLIYPSLAKRFGVEESILYYICQQLLASASSEVQGHNTAKVNVPKAKWHNLTSLWDEEKLAQLAASLIGQGAVNIEYLQHEIVIEAINSDAATATATAAIPVETLAPDPKLLVNNQPVKPEVGRSDVKLTLPNISPVKESGVIVQSFSHPVLEPTHSLPVYDVPPAPASRPLPMRRVNDGSKPNFEMSNGELLKGVGHAPSFGGFRKRSNASDPFEKFLDDREQQNKKLYSMTMDWEPSKLLFNTLTRSNIPHEVALSYLDEFRLYYCDRNTKERSWDQKFLAWVKKGWVKKQSAENRAQNVPSQAGFKHENSQRDTREKRKRITAAIMDIHDTNW